MSLTISVQHRTSDILSTSQQSLRSYILHPDSKDHTGYNISFYGTTRTFHNRSVKQTAVATSSTHAEARAIFTLAKELNFLIALCQELQIPLELPALIMEDNSAVVTMANNDSRYTKKCKHFLMVSNYSKEQIVLGLIEARKIYGKVNTAEMHTKPLRSSELLSIAHKILDQLPPQPLMPTVSSSSTLPTETVSCIMDTDVKSQLSNETKRSLLADSAHMPNSTTQGTHPSLYYSPCFGLDNRCGRTCPRPQSDCTAV